jgi:hypothetical protein
VSSANSSGAKVPLILDFVNRALGTRALFRVYPKGRRGLVVGAVAALVLGACGDPTGEKRPPWPADPVEFDGPFEISGAPRYYGVPTQPVRLWLIGRNVGDVPGRVAWGRCSLGIEIYMAAARAGAPFWSSRARDAGACTPGAKFEDTLTPRSEIQLETEFFSGADIGASSTPTRFYYVLVYRDRAGVHRVPAGEDDLSR